MKRLKKISLAYALQIFAVIFLFGYAVKSPEHKMKTAATNGAMPLDLNKTSIVKRGADSVSTEKINTFWNVFTAKSW